MAADSVDDMYIGCNEEMKSKVQNEYLQNEKNMDGNFQKAWDIAVKRKIKGALSKKQAAAIYVYTLDEPRIYPEFNNAVRTQQSEYKTTFRYHAFHFFLTSALQSLNARKSEEERCLTGFRRVNSYFSQNVLENQIRFGSFTSSSLGSWPKPERFGNKSCFEISTCLGADISLYSKHEYAEREVLIPPYEVFKVIKIEKRADNENLPCEVVYKVNSTDTFQSNLNSFLLQNKE